MDDKDWVVGDEQNLKFHQNYIMSPFPMKCLAVAPQLTRVENQYQLDLSLNRQSSYTEVSRRREKATYVQLEVSPNTMLCSCTVCAPTIFICVDKNNE